MVERKVLIERIVVGIGAALFLVHGLAAVMRVDGIVEAQNGRLGVPLWAISTIGALEITAAIAMIVPASRFYGAAALSAIAVGAIVVHLANTDWAGWLLPLVHGVPAAYVAWVRQPAWFARMRSRIG